MPNEPPSFEQQDGIPCPKELKAGGISLHLTPNRAACGSARPFGSQACLTWCPGEGILSPPPANLIYV